MSRRLLAFAVILLPLIRHPAMGQMPMMPPPETQEDNQQLFQQMQQELDAKEARLRDIENQLYEWRGPTEAEVEARRKAWTEANPFKTSFDMPDFAKEQVRVRRTDPASIQQQGDAQALQDRIAKIEANMEAMKARPARANPHPAIAPPPSKPLSQPKPSSVAMLTHPDGTVTVSIGAEFFQFKNDVEAKAFVEKRSIQSQPPAKQ